ncbi:uncharacterized protein LOC129260798 [Lytechinus pictus]|uniref:uncharacterized protein LOC129260798 n=1 Tax=Lytechinus pictus TaxID=7653 RepID=UPI0030BA127D
MAGGSEDVSAYVEQFRLINEPTNHWDARKKFLLNNWDDYPEMQLVSLSMVWANMQFDGCKYSPELMDRVRDMAAGISDRPTTASRRSSSNVRPQGPSLLIGSSCPMQDPNEKHSPNSAASQHPFSLSGNEGGSSTSETGLQKLAKGKDISGNDITISKDTPLIPICPSGDQQFHQLIRICNRLKEIDLKGRTDKQVRAALLNFLCKPEHNSRYEFCQVVGKQKEKGWRAFFILGEVLCSTGVDSSKKAGKEKALTLFETLVKYHQFIALQKSCRKEANEHGIVYELVFMDERPLQMCTTSIAQDLNQEQSVDSTSSTVEDIEKDDRKVISVESILESLPHQFANHSLNSFINPAPKIPGFVLYESREDEDKHGDHTSNPVCKVVNSCSMCKVPCEFMSRRCEISRGIEGIVCTVFICHENIATGLAFAVRHAKHLAAHNAIKALKMTNPVLVKTSTGDGTSIERDELAGGGGASASKGEKLPETNVGHKLLKMMGWKGDGAGLGKREDGRANPVEATGSGSRSKKGLGCDTDSLRNPQTNNLDDRKVFRFLQDFAHSEREDELVFSSELSKDDRKKLHSIALKLGLKSKSRGKNESRYLIIGRKWNVGNLVQAVEEKGGSMGGYQLHGPPM